MHHVVHQFKKDLGQNRWALIAWGCLLLVHLVISGFQILRLVPNPDASTDEFANLIATWVVFTPLLFVLLAVQADTPVGTTKFWLTRPVRGPKMLGAKALFVSLFFVLLPLLVEAAIILLRGGSSEIWLLLPEFTIVRLPVVLAACALGAATSGFLQALMLASIGAAISLTTMMVGTFALSGGGVHGASPFSASRGIAALWFLAITFGAVVAIQFLTRREALSRGLFATGIFIAMLVQLLSPWQIIGRASAAAGVAAPAAVELGIETARAQVGETQLGGRNQEPSVYLSLPVEISDTGLPANQVLAPVASRIGLSSESFSSRPAPVSQFVLPEDPRFYEALASIFSDQPITLARPHGELDPTFQLSQAYRFPRGGSQTWQREISEIHVEVELGHFAYERAGEIPLGEGERWQDGANQIEIVSATATSGSLNLKLREQAVSLTFAPQQSLGRRNSFPTVLILVNPTAKKALVLNRNQSTSRYRGASWISPHLSYEETINVHLHSALAETFDRSTDTAKHWLEDSVLVVVRRQVLGSLSVERSLAAAEIELLN